MSDEEPDPRSGPVAAVRWFLTTDHPGISFVREALASALAVIGVGILLFLVSGVWPPLVAVESGSMQPHMNVGDLVFVIDEDRFVPDAAVADTGVVTYRIGADTGYRTFGSYGNVIVYNPPSRSGPPIIHRARFYVTEGQNWVAAANPAYLGGRDCEDLTTCPADHAGFITKGDANPYYDQAQGIADVVRTDWIRGTAEVSVPWLGHVRLAFTTITFADRTATTPSPPPSLPPTSRRP